MTSFEMLTMNIIDIVLRAPGTQSLIGFFAVLGVFYVSFLAGKHRKAIAKAFKVEGMTKKEVKEFMKESAQGKYLSREVTK